MPYEMKNCVLWHVPKTGGTWAYKLLYEKGITFKRTFTGHATPAYHPELLMKPGIIFVREPLGWYKSMFAFGIKQYRTNKLWLERWFDDDFWNKNIIQTPKRESNIQDAENDDYDHKLNFKKFLDWIIAEKPGYYTQMLADFQASRFIVCRTENLAEDFSKVLPLFEDISPEDILNFPKQNATKHSSTLVYTPKQEEIILDFEKAYLETGGTKVDMRAEELHDFIFRRAKEGISSDKVADELNFNNIKSPKGIFWNSEQVKQTYHDEKLKTKRYDVSIIIAGRNYGRYLPEAISSAMDQTKRPLEIIYVDNESTDSSLKIAEQYLNVKVFSVEHSGVKSRNEVAKARNLGAKHAKGKYLLFLDADDILTKNYIEQSLCEIEGKPKVVGVFNAARSFSAFNNYWKVPEEYRKFLLWQRNYCNTSTLFLKDAFMAAGGWCEDLNTAWDWNLSLRLSKYGKLVPGNSTLLYRFHKSNWSNVNQESLRFSSRTQSLTREATAGVDICCILSDRLLDNFPNWLNAIKESLSEYNSNRTEGHFPFPIKPGLRIMYTGINREALPNIHDDAFSSVTWSYVPFELDENLPEPERRNAVAQFLANSYNNFLASSANVFWFVEDDIMVPSNAFEELYSNLMSGEVPKFATCGVYRSRHDNHLLAYMWNNDKGEIIQQHEPLVPQEIDLPEENRWIACTGTGCFMIFKDATEEYFGSHHCGYPAHDWNFCWKLSQKNNGWPSVYMCSKVKCKHMINCEEYVDV